MKKKRDQIIWAAVDVTIVLSVFSLAYWFHGEEWAYKILAAIGAVAYLEVRLLKRSIGDP